LERGASDRFKEVAAQVQSTELREREAGVDSFQDLAVEAPLDVPIVIALVVEGEACLLKRCEVSSNRPGGDVEILRQCIDGGAMS